MLELIRNAGREGMTVHEVAARLERTPNCVSGRLSELSKAGLIRRSGRRRKGAAVWVS